MYGLLSIAFLLIVLQHHGRCKAGSARSGSGVWVKAGRDVPGRSYFHEIMNGVLTMKQTKGLKVFLRDECANYDKHRESCLVGDSCKVMNGRRCSYFERFVFGPPDYPFKIPGYDYAKLFGQYAEQTGADAQKVKQRRCDCGTPLRHRQRHCDDCTVNRRRKTKRESQRQYRQVRVA